MTGGVCILVRYVVYVGLLQFVRYVGLWVYGGLVQFVRYVGLEVYGGLIRFKYFGRCGIV